MPIKIPKLLPAREILENENIFVMDEDRAITQDIRPLNILILNLMPEKEMEETQLLRHLSNTPLQVNISFMKTATHQSKNTSHLHLEQFYTVFNEVENKKFDGMIITGAPVERLPFAEVDYWNELKEIMQWSKSHVTSTLHICWGAQAALFYHFGIDKVPYPEKLSGVFSHSLYESREKLLRGFDDVFFAPHSRYTDIDRSELAKHPEVHVLAGSEEAGPFVMMVNKGKQIMITGHLEYDTGTLAKEYRRDLNKNMNPGLPKHYFPNDNSEKQPINNWRSHAHLLFSNWLNYYVYQETPYQWG
ncbi:homoserine O-succinyltransferase [Sporolactobacillus shoreicorticis]|uniref:Homoserine O-acetyltransferase n=1 Tax=Sporolactobacillus shoreicorticis TaxID=1923877 RepID=A0ABW5RZX2_9BACL|nr:homoserine O-succinyltransferase [Sporolactobacillus shoreicorticis]MCO7127006.1 homoserine O-succinyltransferase [Sporolactobacillus shoreicorticis]